MSFDKMVLKLLNNNFAESNIFCLVLFSWERSTYKCVSDRGCNEFHAFFYYSTTILRHPVMFFAHLLSWAWSAHTYVNVHGFNKDYYPTRLLNSVIVFAVVVWAWSSTRCVSDNGIYEVYEWLRFLYNEAATSSYCCCCFRVIHVLVLATFTNFIFLQLFLDFFHDFFFHFYFYACAVIICPF